ncbi:MAG: DUF488 family protein [Rhodanobacteraceae bacterium]
MTHRVRAANAKLKCAYEKPVRDDGTRVLIDRLWPRGVTKQRAKVDQWVKDLAPSTALRKWFGHAPARWLQFHKHYVEEVRNHPYQLRALARKGTITLVYSAHDEIHNDAMMLRELVLGRMPRVTIKPNLEPHEPRASAGRLI